MAIEAAKTVLEKSKTPAEDIDMIVFASDTPEYTVPTNALLINKALGTTNANTIFDINNNCTSMVVALDNATHFMKAHKDVKKSNCRWQLPCKCYGKIR